MVLTSLRIDLRDFGRDKGRYLGSAEFAGNAGSVELRLTPEMCNRIFIVCADGILETAKEAAANLTVNVIEHRQAIDEE